MKAVLVIAMFVPLHNPNNIVIDKPLRDTYDFIIIGSGWGGSVMASRLTEEPHHSALLLEAGKAGSAFTEWPLLSAALFDDDDYDWKYRSVRDEGYFIGMTKQRGKLRRARMLGGQSTFSFMTYLRGNRRDYDRWEKLGNDGWSYQDVLPYFIRSEDMRDRHLRRSPYHGVGGPVPVSPPRYISDLGPLFIRAAKYLGFSIGDVNGDSQTRFTHPHTTAKYGERWSAARAFLRPASHRPNLNIQVKAHVTRIIIDPVTKRARGVVFFKKKKRHVVWARKEVILSAGTFQSPLLLKLSGVGPCDELNKFGIPCIYELPGVGENLQSQIGLGDVDFVTEKNRGVAPSDLSSPTSFLKYIKDRSGPLATPLAIEGVGFAHSGVDNSTYHYDWPDLGLFFVAMGMATDGGYFFRNAEGINSKLWKRFAKYQWKSGYRIIPVNLRPRSRGRVLLRSRNPFQHPDIFLNLFDDPHDLAVLREGGRLAERLGTTPPFLRVSAKLNSQPNPYCFKHPAGGPDWWDCRIRVFPLNAHEETSSCAMGPPDDHYAVVDNQLRVYGIAGLRVVDASVFPRVTSGSINAPVIMVAERAADLVKAYWHAVHLGVDAAEYVDKHVLHSGGVYQYYGNEDKHVDAHDHTVRDPAEHVDDSSDVHVEQDVDEVVDEGNFESVSGETRPLGLYEEGIEKFRDGYGYSEGKEGLGRFTYDDVNPGELGYDEEKGVQGWLGFGQGIKGWRDVFDFTAGGKDLPDVAPDEEDGYRWRDVFGFHDGTSGAQHWTHNAQEVNGELHRYGPPKQSTLFGSDEELNGYGPPRVGLTGYGSPKQSSIFGPFEHLDGYGAPRQSTVFGPGKQPGALFGPGRDSDQFDKGPEVFASRTAVDEFQQGPISFQPEQEPGLILAEKRPDVPFVPDRGFDPLGRDKGLGLFESVEGSVLSGPGDQPAQFGFAPDLARDLGSREGPGGHGGFGTGPGLSVSEPPVPPEQDRLTQFRGLIHAGGLPEDGLRLDNTRRPQSGDFRPFSQDKEYHRLHGQYMPYDKRDADPAESVRPNRESKSENHEITESPEVSHTTPLAYTTDAYTLPNVAFEFEKLQSKKYIN